MFIKDIVTDNSWWFHERDFSEILALGNILPVIFFFSKSLYHQIFGRLSNVILILFIVRNGTQCKEEKYRLNKWAVQHLRLLAEMISVLVTNSIFLSRDNATCLWRPLIPRGGRGISISCERRINGIYEREDSHSLTKILRQISNLITMSGSFALKCE